MLGIKAKPLPSPGVEEKILPVPVPHRGRVSGDGLAQRRQNSRIGLQTGLTWFIAILGAI